MAILSKTCKPDNFESHNSLKLSFTNIRSLRSSFFDCESFLNQTLLTFLPCGRQTWMNQVILAIYLWEVILLQSEKILVFICTVSQFVWKKDFLFARDLSLENSGDYYLYFWLALLHSVLLLCPLLTTFLVFVHGFWFYFI